MLTLRRKRKRIKWIFPKEARNLHGDDLDTFTDHLDLILEISDAQEGEWVEELRVQCRFLRENPTYQQHELMGNDAPFNTPPWLDARQLRSYLRHGRGMVTGVARAPINDAYLYIGGKGYSEYVHNYFANLIRRSPGLDTAVCETREAR